MILQNVKRKIIVNAGHYINDPGSQSAYGVERDECFKIRDNVVSVLRSRGYEVVPVPDTLDLAGSIKFANEKAPGINDALAIDIHLNYSVDAKARGTEAYYGVSDTSKKIAASLAYFTAASLCVPTRGAKPDTDAAVGSLGWIRQTKMWASLVEVCFISNKDDMTMLKPNGYRAAAVGIANAIDDLFGVTPDESDTAIGSYSDDELLAEVRRRM